MSEAKWFKVMVCGGNFPLAVGTEEQCVAAAREIERDHDISTWIEEVDGEAELEELRERYGECFCEGV